LSDEELNQNFIISSITLHELENIKTSRNKDFEVKVAARHVLHKLFENRGKYQIVIYQPEDLELLGDNHFDITDDIKILSGALWADRNIAPDDITFVTNDLALSAIANLYFGDDSIEYIEPKEDDYKGYKEVYLDENLME
jgi:hypothetical protein